jgi:hypothetical protein
MDTADAIKQWVTEKLGCRCPEEVFRHIDIQHEPVLAEDLKLTKRINIGNRLLIYLLKVDDAQEFKEKLKILLDTGIKDRDVNKFNRIRIVIIADRKNDYEKYAVEFSKLNKDDKAHLHILGPDEIG